MSLNQLQLPVFINVYDVDGHPYAVHYSRERAKEGAAGSALYVAVPGTLTFTLPEPIPELRVGDLWVNGNGVQRTILGVSDGYVWCGGNWIFSEAIFRKHYAPKQQQR